ncbi:MAG: FtsX-like permease family protein, partial [Terriglobia bacterium]
LGLPRTGEIRLDGTVLGFTVALSIATGVLFGLLPSLRASRPDLAGALRDYGAGAGLASGRRGALGLSTRGLLVAGQVALSIVLLIGAALLMQSLVRLERVNPGFEPMHLLTMRIALPPARYDTIQKRAAFFRELVQRIESAPGVTSAAVTWMLPMTGWAGSPVEVVEQPPVKFTERPIGIVETITPEYFRTLKIPFIRGREFTAHDIAGAVPVVIISESMARHFWPAYPNGQNPVGQHILVGATWPPMEIVGIVADVDQSGLDAGPRPELYAPFAQHPPQSAMLAVRTKSNPTQFVNVVRSRILTIDPDQPVSAVKTMDEVIEASVGRPRLVMLLLGLFAGVALLLATVGIYGVISYSVAHRTQEMGIRLALGAQQRDILRLVAGQGLGLALVGVAIGLGGAVALTRVMKALLFQVSATDPATFVGIALVFALVALLACYIPARRAMKVDPMEALRHE